MDSSSTLVFSRTVIGKCQRGEDVTLACLSEDQGVRLGAIFSGVDPWAAYGISAQSMVGYLCKQEAGAPRLGIEVDGTIVGIAGFRINWLRGPYLQFLGIIPEFQNRGIGGLVLDWFEREAEHKDCQNLWVIVSQINRNARSFYEAHGFVEACELNDLVVEGRDEILLRKRLSLASR